MNKRLNKFSPEVRERAVRLVQEHRGEYPSLWAAIESIAPKIGCVPQTLSDWVKRYEVDSGQREGLSSSEREQLKALQREVKELRRANDILKTASAFFDLAGSTADSRVEGPITMTARIWPWAVSPRSSIWPGLHNRSTFRAGGNWGDYPRWPSDFSNSNSEKVNRRISGVKD
jgi:transposase-like protein